MVGNLQRLPRKIAHPEPGFARHEQRGCQIPAVHAARSGQVGVGIAVQNGVDLGAHATATQALRRGVAGHQALQIRAVFQGPGQHKAFGTRWNWIGWKDLTIRDAETADSPA